MQRINKLDYSATAIRGAPFSTAGARH